MTSSDNNTDDRLLKPSEVAELFRVDPKTVTRWAAAGLIDSVRTPGGQRRYRLSEIMSKMEGNRSRGEDSNDDPAAA